MEKLSSLRSVLPPASLGISLLTTPAGATDAILWGTSSFSGSFLLAWMKEEANLLMGPGGQGRRGVFPGADQLSGPQVRQGVLSITEGDMKEITEFWN